MMSMDTRTDSYTYLINEVDEKYDGDDDILSSSEKKIIATLDVAPGGLTMSCVIVGLFVGSLLSFSNMFFALQTGWVTMGSLQSSLLGFGICQLLRVKNFGSTENVLLQTVAVATATMPLAGGYAGVIPALNMINGTGNLKMTWWQSLLFTLSIAFIGVFVAVPLRKQVLLREKLKFPSGTATAKLISVIHERNGVASLTWKVLGGSFAVGVAYDLFGYFIPVLKVLPIFGSVAAQWGFTFTLSPSYIGQGMLMGFKTASSMMLGAIVGWALLGPLARYYQWAPGNISSNVNGAAGWLMWVAVAIMLTESIVGVLIVTVQSVRLWYGQRKHRLMNHETDHINATLPDFAGKDDLVPTSVWVGGLVLSTAVCVAILSPVFSLKWYEPLLAVVLSCGVSLVAVRALGSTDMNPVAGVSKITQLIFSGVAPGDFRSNIISGGVTEAAAQQAGDLMQDLRTGYLLRVSPRLQFYAQCIGTLFSIICALAAWELYTNAYTVPSPQFRVPSAGAWVDMAKMAYTGEFPGNVGWFCLGFGSLFALLSIVEALLDPQSKRWFPSGVGFAIGLYLQPHWTIPRFIGAILQVVWQWRYEESYKRYGLVVASGLVLGEGIMSIPVAGLSSGNVPVWTCFGCMERICPDPCFNSTWI